MCTGRYHRRRVQINDDDVQVSVKNPLEQCDLSKIKDFVNLEYLEIIITVVLVILIIALVYHLFRKWRASIHKRATRQVMLRTISNKSRESIAETAAQVDDRAEKRNSAQRRNIGKTTDQRPSSGLQSNQKVQSTPLCRTKQRHQV